MTKRKMTENGNVELQALFCFSREYFCTKFQITHVTTAKRQDTKNKAYWFLILLNNLTGNMTMYRTMICTHNYRGLVTSV